MVSGTPQRVVGLHAARTSTGRASGTLAIGPAIHASRSRSAMQTAPARIKRLPTLLCFPFYASPTLLCFPLLCFPDPFMLPPTLLCFPPPVCLPFAGGLPAPENKNSCSTVERGCKAAIMGCVIPFCVGVLAIIASVCKGSFSLEVWGTAVEFVAIALIPSAVAGGVGGTTRNGGLGAAYGTVIFLCVVGEYWWWGRWNTWPFFANLIVFASAVGALVGGAGAVIARAVPADTKETGWQRLSLSESVVGVILATILLFYIFWIV